MSCNAQFLALPTNEPIRYVASFWFRGATNPACTGSLSVTNPGRVTTLAWDGCAVTNGWNETNYFLFWSWTGKTNSLDCGTNMTQAVTLYPPSKTNHILTITTVNATNIRYRPPGGTWFLANTNYLRFTNPPASQLTYQPMGTSKNSRATITIRQSVE